MDEALKARLIGAAVLVALAVLLIPELLSGRKSAEPAVEEGAATRGTRTFTIELGKGTGPATHAGDVPAVPAPPAGDASGASSASSSKAGTASAAADTSDDSADGRAGAGAPSPEPAKVAAEPKVTPPATSAAPDGASAERKPPPAPAAQGGGWAVQVGAFSASETARKLARDLGGAGYRTYVSPVTRSGRTLYRVRVGPEPDRAAAEQLVPRLKARGLPATVVQND